jgi:hypothetical protein
MRLATYLLAGMTSASLLVCAPAANAQSERFSVVANGTKVGYLNVDGDVRRRTIAFDYKINGRGPSSTETLELDAAGLPVAWKIDGATTFGSKTKESFRFKISNSYCISSLKIISCILSYRYCITLLISISCLKSHRY